MLDAGEGDMRCPSFSYDWAYILQATAEDSKPV